MPKNTSKYHWTNHAAEKMRYYGLSEGRIIRVVRNPSRVEEGIAEKTIAVMCPYGTSSRGRHPYKGEIWVMYSVQNQKSKFKSQNYNSKIKNLSQNFNPNKKIIISAWKYPGVSPKGKVIPIPEDIKAEIEQVLQSPEVGLS